MKLIDNFFYIKDISTSATLLKAQLRLNQGHAIYGGHFPGQPVFPGALMVQTVLELLRKEYHQNLQLGSADSIKFLTILDPRINPEIDVEVKSFPTSEGILIEAQLFAGAVIFFKLKAALKSA